MAKVETNMMDFAGFQGRVAGSALLLSILSLVFGLLIIALQGKFGGLAASFSGVEGIGEKASANLTLAKAAIPMTLLQIVGFGILSVILREKGVAIISTVSFGILLFALALTSFRGAFHGTVSVWAAELWASSGSVPELYKPLETWVGLIFEVAYIGYFVAMAGFGWGVLNTGILPSWVAWLSIGWSAIWVAGYIFHVGLPAFILIPPLIFGVALLIY